MIFQFRRKDGRRPFIAWGDAHRLAERTRSNTISWMWSWREFLFGVRGYWGVPFNWTSPSLSFEAHVAFFSISYGYTSFKTWRWKGEHGIWDCFVTLFFAILSFSMVCLLMCGLALCIHDFYVIHHILHK